MAPPGGSAAGRFWISTSFPSDCTSKAKMSPSRALRA